MELVSNLWQFAVTLLGFCLSGLRYLKSRRQEYFLLTCFYGCFTLGSLYWTLYLLLFSKTPQVFYVSEFGWVASVVFSFYPAICSFLHGGKKFSVPESHDCSRDRCSTVRILLHLWRHSLQSALVRDDDRCFLSCYTGPCLCPDAGGRCAQAAIFPRRSVVLCDGGICLWTSGCFWPGDSIYSPYCWFDLLLTICIFALLPATGKAVQA